MRTIILLSMTTLMHQIAFSSARRFRDPPRTAFATLRRSHRAKHSPESNALQRILPRLLSAVSNEEDVAKVPKKFKPYPFQVSVVTRSTANITSLSSH